MEQQSTILNGYSDLEKGAYLGAIASLTTADSVASEEELNYINTLCESAGLSEEQTALINNAAKSEMADDDLKRCLDVLKTSELRYSLITDVIAFAQSDQSYGPEEKQSIAKMAEYLGVNGEQVSLLDQFTKKAVEEAPRHAEAASSEEATPAGFLDKVGLGDKLKSVGINTSTLLKGAVGILGPLLLAKMFSGRRRTAGVSAAGSGGGLFGGLLGGGLGGLLSSGGLLGGLLGGGRGFGNTGGMLGRIFRGLGR
jgi:uncharacterized tellurite resistance protein B-like protein